MDRIEEFLQERKNSGLFRSLRAVSYRREGKICLNGNEYFDFSSNDYLGFSQHPGLKEAARKATEELGTSSSGSRLLSGDLNIHHQLENRTAEFKCKEAALIFNSGYQANVGIISSLCRKDDVIFSDRLNHASIIDGIILSQAKFFRFNHNDLNHLESLLKKERHKFKKSLIITETIFSMDGDRPSLKEIVSLKEKYNSMIMVDEAHATGIFGENGSGVVEEENLTGNIDLIMGTFSKALGSFGAYLACSNRVKEYLINICRSFIYSTALPPSVIAANLVSLDLVRDEPFRRKTLLENANYLRQELQKHGFRVKGTSQIIPLIIGDSQKAIKLSENLKKNGYYVLPIRPPTVPAGEARLRFSLTCQHSKNILEKLVDDICRIYDI